MSCLFDSMVALLRPYGVRLDGSSDLRSQVVSYIRSRPECVIGEASAPVLTSGSGRCQRCDKPGHLEAACPYFAKERERSSGDGTIGAWLGRVSQDMRTDPTSYLARMARQSAWGGGLEIAALSSMYGVRIIVERNGARLAVFDSTRGSALADFHLNWTGSHYTPIRFVETI